MNDDCSLLYVANTRLPSKRAKATQVIQMCSAFAETGADVTLVVPARSQPSDAPDSSIEEYYDVRDEFDIRMLPCVDALLLVPYFPTVIGKGLFYLESITFALSAMAYLFRYGGSDEYSLIYCRARMFAILGAFFFGDKLVYSSHRTPPAIVYRFDWVFDQLRGVVVPAEGLAKEWTAITETEILTVPNGVDVDKFAIGIDAATAKRELSLDSEAPLVCYVGSLKEWKGVDTFVQAARHIEQNGTQESSTQFLMVGGSNQQRDNLLERVGSPPENLRFEGHVPPSDVPSYLCAADVLVLPNTSDSKLSREYTNPLKMFEYLAAGRPIVATDIPSIRSILTDDTAEFVPPDDPEAMAAAIQELLSTPERAATLAKAASDAAGQYSWANRAKRIFGAFCNH